MTVVHEQKQQFLIDGLVYDCSKPNALAKELLQPGTKPAKYSKELHVILSTNFHTGYVQNIPSIAGCIESWYYI